MIPRRYRMHAALLIIVGLFGGYGVKEIRGAIQYGTSVHDGVEALVMGAVIAALLGFAIWRQGRSRLR